MRRLIIGITVCAVLVLSGCGAQKRLAGGKEAARTWYTAQVTNTMLTMELDQQTYNVLCQMQTVRDSMSVISVMPVMNIELLRIEVTPDSAVIIDKANRRYMKLALSQAKGAVFPALKWADIQSFAAGECVQPNEPVSLGYSYQGHTIRLSASYGTVTYDGAVNVKHQRLDRYQAVDFNTLMR